MWLLWILLLDTRNFPNEINGIYTSIVILIKSPGFSLNHLKKSSSYPQPHISLTASSYLIVKCSQSDSAIHLSVVSSLIIT